MPAGSQLNVAIPGPDDLISGNIRTQPVTLAAGTYVRGEVVGLVEGETTYKKLSVASTVPKKIIPQAMTLGADTVVPVYFEGDFNEDAVTLTGGVTLAAAKVALADVGIMLRKWGAAGPV